MADWTPVFKDTYDPLKAGSIDATDTEPHDHGIVRAMAAKYKPNKYVVGDPLKTIFVARLNPKTNEETIERIFSIYGDIKRFRLVRDLVTGFSRGYAFVEYSDRHGADMAQRQANKTEIDGCEILVDHECERTLKGWVPRRLGGGLGGKKESGQLRFGGRDRPFRKPIFDVLKNFKQGHDKNDERGVKNYEYRHEGDRDTNRDERRDSHRDRGNFGKKRSYMESSCSNQSPRSSYGRYDKETCRESREKEKYDESYDKEKYSGSYDKEKYSERKDHKSRNRSRDIERDHKRERSHERKKRSKYQDDRKRERSSSRKNDRNKEEKYRNRDTKEKTVENPSDTKVINKLIEENIKSIWDDFEPVADTKQ